jgi:hypothetical protein
MPGSSQVIALGIVAVLAAVLSTFAYRLTRWFLETRQRLAFQVATSDIARRAEDTLGPISELVDAVRRGMRPGEEISGDLARAMAAAAASAAEARRLQPPPEGAAILAGMVESLERAERALEMIDHGCQLTEAGSRREHDPEAQTAIKRGYLNLLHARDAIAEHVAGAANLPIPGPRLLARRVGREVRQPRS